MNDKVAACPSNQPLCSQDVIGKPYMAAGSMIIAAAGMLVLIAFAATSVYKRRSQR